MSVIITVCQKDVSLGTAGSLVLPIVQVTNDINIHCGVV